MLGARRYAAAGSFVVRVEDSLGFADGTWQMTIDDAGTPTLRSLTPERADTDLTCSVGALSAVVLGGVSARTLRSAGLIDGDEQVVTALDASLASPHVPYLSLWY